MSDRFDKTFADAAQPVPYKARLDVRVSVGSQQEGEPQYFLKSSAGELFVFHEQEFFLWEALDGKNSLADINDALRARFGTGIATDDFSEFLNELVESALVERIANSAEEPETAVRRVRLTYSRDGTPQSRPLEQPLSAGPSQRDRPREPLSFVLFNPDRLFGAIAHILWPFRRLVWLLIPFAFFACLVIVHNFAAYAAAAPVLIVKAEFWLGFFAAELAVNLLVRMTQGVVLRGFGRTVQEFGVRLRMGWWPRFYVERPAANALPREAWLWFYGSTLLTRLAAFAVGTTIWGLYWRTNSAVANIGLMFGQIGLVSFIVCAFPLLPLDGSRWLATALGQPRLLQRSAQFLRMRLSGRPAPEAMTSSERWGLAVFGVGTLIAVAIMLVWIAAFVFARVVDRLQGVGFLLVLLQFAVAIPYVLLLRRYARRRDALRRSAQASAARRMTGHFESTLGH